jgi:propionyl-CoA synthetase
MGDYAREHRRSISDPASFWAEQARSIHWYRDYDQVVTTAGAPSGKWFVGGRVNACHEALDRHVAAGASERLALVHDSAMTGSIERLTYGQLLAKVAELAGWLQSRGVVAGDRVLIYMPLVPEAVVAMLACARIGAVHAVVFGGFGAREVATRIDDTEPKLILTASCGLEPGRVVEYLPLLNQALQLCRHRPAACLVLQRPQAPAQLTPGRDLDWQQTVPGSAPAPCVPVDANHPLYVLHTSGTTGRPKGIVRDTAGYLVALRYSMRAVYGVAEGDVFWAASDIGWVVGHSYIVYGPLAHGCTTILYEGKPVGTPDAAQLWRVAARHGVNVLFTAPTAIRAVKREDPRGELPRQHDLGSLRALFLAGERADPDTVLWARQALERPVIDHWWQTETGWPVAANCLGIEPLAIKPGSVSVPVPGFDVRVLDEGGAEVPAGATGSIVIKLPMPPGCLPTLWHDDEGFRSAYLSRFPGYYLTGDGGLIDGDGFLHVMGRIDDVINVAGHRLSTGEIEQALAGHPDVAECAVIPREDAIKGQVPMGLVVLKVGVSRPLAALQAELVARVRDEVGPVAAFRECHVVARLPKTRSGKVLRGTMRRIAAGEQPPVPATIDDPAVLDEIRAALRGPAPDGPRGS